MLETSDWQVINLAIARAVSESALPQFAQGPVIKNDIVNNLVWLDEFGPQPIPLFSFEYDVKYYDIRPSHLNPVTTGQIAPIETLIKKAIVTVKCPKVGDTVLIAKHFGDLRLPKCIGVLHSKNFVIPVGT